MNYILTVDSSKVDKVISQLSALNIEITDVVRSSGYIHVNTKTSQKLNQLNEVVEIKRDTFFSQLLF